MFSIDKGHLARRGGLGGGFVTGIGDGCAEAQDLSHFCGFEDQDFAFA
jgi:hypothetical protein